MDFHRTSAGMRRFCLVLLLAAPGVHAASPAPAAAPTAAQDNVAQVGGQPLRRALLDAMVEANAGRANPFDEESAQDRQARADARATLDRNAMLGQLVTMELMAQEAVKLGLHQSPDLVAEAELAYKTLLQRDLVRHLLSTMPVTEDEIAQRYQGVPAERQFHVGTVDVAGPAAARAALAALRQGKRFTQVAKRYAGRPNPPAPEWLMTAQMDAAMAQQLAGMKPGQAIERPSPQGGIQVVQLIDAKDVPKPALADLRPGLRTQIMQDKLAQRIDALKARTGVQLTAEQAPAQASVK